MAYIYAADVWCDDCGESVRARLATEGKAPADPDDETEYDSGDYPKGPYPDDEESDCPQHCGAGADCLGAERLPDGPHVGAFLRNALTDDGRAYVAEAVAEAWTEGKTERDSVALALWADEYGADLVNVTYADGTRARWWDESFGDWYVYVETLGALGIVRAQTWEEAYQCAVDEIQDGADPADPDTYARSYDPSADPEELADGCHYRGSGNPSNSEFHPNVSGPIACGDINGSALYSLASPQGQEWFKRAGFQFVVECE